MKINTCRNCKKKKLTKLFSLGKLSFTGKFSNTIKSNIPKAEITLVICHKCKLVQLDRNFNPKYLYGKDYGYRSGINKTMTDHLSKTATLLSNKAHLKNSDSVLDIASNDGTLLRAYNNKKITKVGIDPVISKFFKFYPKTTIQISGFFSHNLLKKKGIKQKFKIITALSVFYDLKNPNQFLKDVKKILCEKEGIFLLEFADLLSIVKYKLFDTICHEHLEYYSAKVILRMLKKNDLKVIDLQTNDINGGSVRFFICARNANYKINKINIKKYLIEERKYQLEKIDTFKFFFKKINIVKLKINNLIKNIQKRKKIIHGYGASTKGNVLLQYFNINKTQIPYIADRNPEKNGLYTPGTKINIISEEKSRNLNPDYYLVLPWHFKKEILIRERKIIKNGTKFIFPLPELKFSK
jgi:hypothetical protein